MRITYRLAEPKDAEMFSLWCSNPDIPQIDIEAAQDPTAIVLAFERGEELLSFLPFYFLDNKTIRIAFLNFRLGISNLDKGRVLNTMLKAILDIAQKRSVATITTLTKEGYGIAEWAKKKGFIPGKFEGTRQIFNLEVR